MSVKLNSSKYPVLDDIEVPPKQLENWQITVDMLARIADIPAALIMRVHTEEIEVFVSSQSQGNVYHQREKASLDTGLYCETVMNTQQRLVIANALTDPLWNQNPDIALGMISYCGMPLIWPGGQVFGTLCILDTKENVYSQMTYDLLERFRDSIQFSLNSIYQTHLAEQQRNEVETALHNSEDRFKRLVHLAPIPFAHFTQSGILQHLNERFSRVFGYTTEDIPTLEAWWLKAYPDPTYRAWVINSWSQAVAEAFNANGDIPPCEYQVSCKNGEVRIMEVSGVMLGDDILATFVDLTEHKQTEKKLALDAQRSKALLELPIAAETLDEIAFMQHGQALAENITDSEIAFMHFVNEDQNSIELVAWSQRTLEHCKHYPINEAGIWADALRQRQAIIFNDYAAYPDKHGLPEGHAALQRLISVPVLEKGKVVMLAGVGNKTSHYEQTDVETLKLIASAIWRIVQRKRTEEAFRQSEHKFAAIFNSSPMPITLSRMADGCYIDVNDSFLEFSGFSRAEVLGHKPSDLQIYPPHQERTKVLDLLKEQGHLENYEQPFRIKSGQIANTLLSLKRVSINNEMCIIASALDITERKRAETELEQYRFHLEELVTERTRELEQANNAIAMEMDKLKQVEEKLESFNRDFEAFLDQTTDFIYFKDSDSRFRFCSQTLATITGHKHWHDMRGKHDREVFPPDTAKIYEEEEIPVLTEGKALLNKIAPYYDSNGQSGYVLTNKWPLFDTKGRVVGIFGISRDITDRIQAEAALQEKSTALEKTNAELILSEQKFRGIAEHGPFCIAITDLERNILYSNPLWIQLFGYSIEEMPTTEAWWSVAYPDENYRAELRQRWNSTVEEAILSQSEIPPMESIVTCKDGRQRSMEFRLASTGTFNVIIGIDISKRKQAEAEYKTILETSQDGFWIISAKNGHFIDANPAAVHMLGYAREELLQMTVANIEAAQSPEEVAQNIQKTIAAPDGYSRFQTQHHHRDGSIIDVEVTSQYLNVRDGIFVVFVRDIRESLAANQALQDARHAAEKANRAKSTFLAHMSHELRTPMNVITGMCYLTQRTQLDSRQKRYLQNIDVAAKTLLGLINDVLDLSKIESGKLHIESSGFALEEVLETMVKIQSSRAEEKSLEFNVIIQSDVPRYLIGDGLRLGQVCSNLMSNAIKFTEQGEVVLRVSKIKQRSKKVTLRFEVSDNGIGMTQEFMSRLFRPFEQADDSTTRRFGGTGLGLSICKRLVEAMGGEIGANSTEGKGSTFWFQLSLPLALTPEQQRHSELPEKLKVLVVDDSPSTQEVLQNMLESLSYHVDIVGSGEAAIAAQQASIAAGEHHAYDLILMDWRMSGLDGIETTRRIRLSEKQGKTPIIIMVTAYGTEEVKNSAARVGMDGFLLKPVTSSTLYDAIQKAFSQNLHRDLFKELPTAEAKKSLAGLRVLIAEDNHINREILAEMLTSADIEYTEAENGEIALQRLQQFQYDLILMDVEMPQMNGLEAVQHLRAQERLSQLPVILMTAHDVADNSIVFLNPGVSDALSKPIEPEALYAMLQKWDRRTSTPPSLPNFDGSRVLVVDDVGANRDVMRELLSDSGIEIVEAENGLEGVERISKQGFDLVLMDIEMPIMDGLEATQKIRADGRFNELPIIAVTAHALTGDREKCLTAGMNDYLAKPVNPQQLYLLLGKYLNDLGGVPAMKHRIEKNRDTKAITLPNDSPHLSIDWGLAHVMDNRSLLHRLLLRFLKEHGHDHEILRETFEQKDLKKLGKIAHTLTGVAGGIGARILFEKARQLEDVSEQENATAAGQLLEQVIAEHHTVIEILTQFKATLAPEQTEKTHTAIAPETSNLLLSALSYRLDNGDSRAQKYLLLLNNGALEPDSGGHLKEIQQFIKSFDFDTALLHLRTFANERKIKLTEAVAKANLRQAEDCLVTGDIDSAVRILKENMPHAENTNESP